MEKDSSRRLSAWLVTTYFTLTFYCVGIGLYGSIVTFHAWAVAEKYQNLDPLRLDPLRQFQETGYFKEALQAVREYQSTFTIVMLVFPLMVRTILNVVLFWHRPRMVPKWTVWASLVLQLIIWMSSPAIHRPIQFQLDKLDFSGIVHVRLRQLLYQETPLILLAILTMWMLYLVFTDELTSDGQRLR